MSAGAICPNLVIGFDGGAEELVEGLRATDRARSVVGWLAVIGAVSAQRTSRDWRRQERGDRRFLALVDHGLLVQSRCVHGQPTLNAATRDGDRVGRDVAGPADPVRLALGSRRSSSAPR